MWVLWGLGVAFAGDSTRHHATNRSCDLLFVYLLLIGTSGRTVALIIWRERIHERLAAALWEFWTTWWFLRGLCGPIRVGLNRCPSQSSTTTKKVQFRSYGASSGFVEADS